MTTSFDVAIVGAGHGGAACAISLRQQGYDGSIALIGDESELPYERPPLSKEYLAGGKTFDRLLIRPETFWRERQVSLYLDTRIDEVDAANRVITDQSGSQLGYGTLVWATGGRARKLSCLGHDLQGVHTIRTRADVDRFAVELLTARRIAIVGGGYIGLEAAAVLRKLGKNVVLIEALDRVLARVAAEPLSRFVEQEHATQGVMLRLSEAVSCILGKAGRAYAVQLASGEILEADAVIVGIGILAEVEPLLSAGAEGTGGVTIDGQCRTSLPNVYAIGDCVVQESLFADGASVRIESVQNANDQATFVARAITGKIQPSYCAMPWFWSNQYDLKLQTVGLSAGYDDYAVRGSPSHRSFSVVYARGGRIVAVDAVNMTRDYVQGKRLIEQRAQFDRSRLEDVEQPLKHYPLIMEGSN